MISDILSHTVDELDHYLRDPIWDDIYAGEIRERLIRLRDEANDLRSALDAPPEDTPKSDEPAHQMRPPRGEWIERMMSAETALKLATPFFSRSDLLRRGWTKGLIAELLGPPDWTDTNPHGAGFAPMRCWRQDRVLAAEQNPVFQQCRSRKIRTCDE